MRGPDIVHREPALLVLPTRSHHPRRLSVDTLGTAGTVATGDPTTPCAARLLARLTAIVDRAANATGPATSSARGTGLEIAQ